MSNQNTTRPDTRAAQLRTHGPEVVQYQDVWPLGLCQELMYKMASDQQQSLPTYQRRTKEVMFTTPVVLVARVYLIS